MTENEKRIISLKRAEELKSRIKDYTMKKNSIKTGFTHSEMIKENKRRIMKVLNASEKEWDDWKWQLSNRITDVHTLAKILNLSDEEIHQIDMIGKKFRWAISPYYASLMDPDDPFCPVRRQAVPSIEEMDEAGEEDPMAEEFTSPVEGITRRYPDRLIVKVTNQCAMYCRHCQRRRCIGQKDLALPMAALRKCVEYIRNEEEIRDVLITGGDALLISQKNLEWLLSELHEIPHVEIIRIGTRTPVTMPQRITKELCDVLSKYPPIYLNTHFNHPMEITEDAKKATDMLCSAGVVLGNQAVLLKGINDDVHIMKKLNQELLKIRIRPYYIFHPKEVVGTAHFKVKVQKGMEIMEKLRGYTSGLAIPTYIINAPNGKGKTPILPNYILSWEENKIKLRNWEGEVFYYPN
ncbi:MAG TPA: glutamate 2,3-aminomutase [Defluviitaleaceae bacterium]|nr:glutamate 2,3-aminomutase [Defluviitaleaceae bacterium]